MQGVAFVESAPVLADFAAAAGLLSPPAPTLPVDVAVQIGHLAVRCGHKLLELIFKGKVGTGRQRLLEAASAGRPAILPGRRRAAAGACACRTGMKRTGRAPGPGTAAESGPGLRRQGLFDGEVDFSILRR